jgi:hypothetical protein
MAPKYTLAVVAAPIAVICMMLAGCATEIARTATQFSPAVGADNRYIVVTREVTVTPSAGYSRTLKAGSTWRYVGRIPEGAVYKVQDDVFMLEGKHMHEAYCVIANSELVGFYLAVENAFSPLSSRVPLSLNQK